MKRTIPIWHRGLALLLAGYLHTRGRGLESATSATGKAFSSGGAS